MLGCLAGGVMAANLALQTIKSDKKKICMQFANKCNANYSALAGEVTDRPFFVS